MEIFSLHTVDIFLQGFFLLLCISLGIYILFKDNIELFKNVDKLNEFSRELYKIFIRIVNFRKISSTKSDDDPPNESINYLGLIPLSIIFAFSLCFKIISVTPNFYLGVFPNQFDA